MTLFIDVDGDLDRIVNLHRLESAEIGSLSPDIVNYEGVIVCSKRAFKYIESIAPDKRCFEPIGVRLEIHQPTKIMLNFIAEEKMPDVWTKDGCVSTVWYDPTLNDLGYLFSDYLKNGIVLREIPFRGNISQKQIALAKKQLESFCKCFFAIGPKVPADLSGDIGFKIRTFGSGPDLLFDARFWGFGSSYLDLTQSILDRLDSYISRYPEQRQMIFSEIMSDINSQQIYDIKLD